jgi:hypothetical protein
MVWAKLPDPQHFLAALLNKGGWPAGQWPRGLTAQRYTAAEYRDPSPRRTCGDLPRTAPY